MQIEADLRPSLESIENRLEKWIFSLDDKAPTAAATATSAAAAAAGGAAAHTGGHAAAGGGATKRASTAALGASVGDPSGTLTMCVCA